MTVRFADIEPMNEREVIDHYLQYSLVSLEEAVVPICDLVSNITEYVTTAKLMFLSPVENLNQDESAAIYLYTMASPFHGKLNSAMRSTHINRVKPYFLYLKLFYTALGKLPCKRKIVWRGICVNVSSDYQKGKCIVWHSVSSSSIDASVVTNFLEKNSQCTLFQIQSRHGKLINKHSAFPSENEIVFVPGTKLLVTNKPLDFNGFQLIQLEEMHNPNLKKILPILPMIKKSIINDEKTSKSHQPKLFPATIKSIPILPAIESTTTEEVKMNKCE